MKKIIDYMDDIEYMVKYTDLLDFDDSNKLDESEECVGFLDTEKYIDYISNNPDLDEPFEDTDEHDDRAYEHFWMPFENTD